MQPRIRLLKNARLISQPEVQRSDSNWAQNGCAPIVVAVDSDDDDEEEDDDDDDNDDDDVDVAVAIVLGSCYF